MPVCRQLDDVCKAAAVLTVQQIAAQMENEGVEAMTPADLRQLAEQMVVQHERPHAVREILAIRTRYAHH